MSLVCVLFQVGQRRLRLLGLFSVVGVLFASTGGFGSLFSLAVTPVFRANNRISFYLAFFAIFATALVLDQILRHSRSGVAAIYVAFCCSWVCSIRCRLW